MSAKYITTANEYITFKLGEELNRLHGLACAGAPN